MPNKIKNINNLKFYVNISMKFNNLALLDVLLHFPNHLEIGSKSRWITTNMIIKKIKEKFLIIVFPELIQISFWASLVWSTANHSNKSFMSVDHLSMLIKLKLNNAIFIDVIASKTISDIVIVKKDWIFFKELKDPWYIFELIFYRTWIRINIILHNLGHNRSFVIILKL